MRRMVIRHICCTCLILLWAVTSHSQTLSGIITDARSGEKLIGAYIYDSISQCGTTSNAFGFYAITLKEKENSALKISFVGYTSLTQTHYLNHDTIINFALNANPVQLDEFELNAQCSIEEKAEMSMVSIPMKQLKTMPMLAGELDIVKALQLLPGIKSGHEGQSTMYVRGGSHDQNLLLLDDVPLYNINHLGGFVSIFNPEAINSFKMYKGAFPARYGGRLSSVLDVRMKDGNMKERHMQATLGLISCKFQIEGPIKQDTASYLISARRFMYDLITKPVTWLSNDKMSSGYTFYDLNAKFNYKPSEKDRLLLSFYTGNDKFSANKKEREGYSKTTMQNNAQWGNTLLALRWNRILRGNLFANTTASYTQYRYHSMFEYENLEQKEEMFRTEYSFYSKINDLALKYDLNYYPLANYCIRVGGQHIHHDFSPNGTVTYQTGSDFNADNIKRYISWENVAYIENELSIGKYIKANLGARAVVYCTADKTYNGLEPRGLLSINILHLFALKTSLSTMHQYAHMLSYSGQGLPTDIWLPVTKDIPPQRATVWSVGIAKSLDYALELSIEVYQKQMNNLIDYKEGTGLMGNTFNNWNEIIETGGYGFSQGLEVLLQKQEGRINGWISYTLSESTRQFDNINDGVIYPYIYDTRHDFSITGNYELRKNLTLSATWLYMTGRAMNYPNTIYDVNVIDKWDVSETPEIQQWSIGVNPSRNSIRMHPYHRLDLGLSYRKCKKKSERIINLSIYNAYNKANPYYYYTDWKETTDNNGNTSSEKVIIQRSIFMIMPSISYTWVW